MIKYVFQELIFQLVAIRMEFFGWPANFISRIITPWAASIIEKRHSVSIEGDGLSPNMKISFPDFHRWVTILHKMKCDDVDGFLIGSNTAFHIPGTSAILPNVNVLIDFIQEADNLENNITTRYHVRSYYIADNVVSSLFWTFLLIPLYIGTVWFMATINNCWFQIMYVLIIPLAIGIIANMVTPIAILVMIHKGVLDKYTRDIICNNKIQYQFKSNDGLRKYLLSVTE